jgi:two-component system sensor histidine kinase VicK
MSESQTPLDLTIFEQIARQTSEVWFLFDLSTKRFTYLGPTFEAVWKRKPENLLADPAWILETIHPDDKPYVTNNYGHFMEQKERLRLDFRILHPDGNQRWIALKTYPIEQQGEVRSVCGFAEDDTPRKENLLYMQTTIGKKNASLEIISHDLRGPLGIIKSLASLIEKNLSPTHNQRLVEHTHLIQRVCQRNVDLIRQMTTQEFLESPEVEIDMERLDLVAEVKEVMGQYQQAQETIAKVFELTSSHPFVYAEVDSNKYLSIINNLVSNAIKFTPEQGRIHLHVEQQKDSVLISVQDNGVGIPQKYHSVLFDKFTKARRSGLKGEESVGLGMSIIKRLVEMHQGKIWFESEEHKGTTFYVEIPRKEISTARV